jgi:hypothetical protein
MRREQNVIRLLSLTCFVLELHRRTQKLSFEGLIITKEKKKRRDGTYEIEVGGRGVVGYTRAKHAAVW